MNTKPKVKRMRDKQQRFISEYLKDLNGKQAAIRAGYSRHTAEQQASRLLRNPKVKAAVTVGAGTVLRRAELTATVVLDAIGRQVHACAYGDLRRLFDRHGRPLPIHRLAQQEADLLAGYEVILKNAKAGDHKTDEILKVKLKDHAKFVEMAAKYFGLLQERVEVSGDDEFIAALHAARDRGNAALKKALEKTVDVTPTRKALKEGDGA